MAGDWIAMRLDLYEDPAVAYMAERLGEREEVVVGFLHRVWSWASRQCHDGKVDISITSLGRVTSLPDFPKLMADAGWLEHGTDTEGKPFVRFPNWERWMAESAKKRLHAAKRKQKERVTQMSQTFVTNKRQKATIPRQLRREVYERDGYKCVYCGWEQGYNAPAGVYVGAKLSLHHVIPESKGGLTNADNLVSCCTVCNQKKSNKMPTEDCHTNVTNFCDKSVTTGEERREERDTTKSGISCVRPTIEEVAAYCLERGNRVDPHAWFDHYTANGWKVGRNPMRDWKAAVRQWERNGYSGGNGKASGKTFAQQSQSNVQQLLAKAAADDAAAALASGLAGFIGGSDGK